jgi:hypothetical protein
MDWHDAVPNPLSVSRIPQHTCPLGHSHAYWQWKVASVFMQVALAPAMQRPDSGKGVTQQVWVRRSQGVVPHIGGV